MFNERVVNVLFNVIYCSTCYYETVGCVQMLLIQSKTDILEAQSSFNAALAGVLRSNATYYRFKAEYDLSR